jgi:hypothetical protein
MIITTSQYFCSRCEAEYDPTETVNGDVRSAELTFELRWQKNVETTPIDKDQSGTINLCNACAQSLIDWFQAEGINT